MDAITAKTTDKRVLSSGIVAVTVLLIGASIVISGGAIGSASAQPSAVEGEIESNSTDLDEDQKVITTEITYPNNVSYIDYAEANEGTRQNLQGILVVRLSSMSSYKQRVNRSISNRNNDNNINKTNKRRSLDIHKQSAKLVSNQTNITREINASFSGDGEGISRERTSPDRVVYNINPDIAMEKEEIDIVLDGDLITSIKIKRPHPISVSQIKPINRDSPGYIDSRTHKGELQLRTQRAGSIDELAITLESTESDFSRKIDQTRQDNVNSVAYDPEMVNKHGKEYRITIDGDQFAKVHIEKRLLQGHKVELDKNMSNIDSLKVKFNPGNDGHMLSETRSGYVHRIYINQAQIRVRSQNNVSEFANTERFNQIVNTNPNKETNTIVIDNSATVVEVNGNTVYQEENETMPDQGVFGFLFGN